MEWKELLNENRMRSTKKSNDVRTEFQKDYHRVVISSAFRRLQDKTQVFPLEKSDFIRTRLTHSMEVSSIGKSLSQWVCRQIEVLGKDELSAEQQIAISDILITAGILHDLGNPPFGHFGEVVIQEWFTKNLKKQSFKGHNLDTYLDKQMIQDLQNFEGNAQTIRIVTKLHSLFDIHGMNLTYGLLATLIKYPCASTQIKSTRALIHKKMGYFYAEKETFNKITTEVGMIECRHPLTFLLEAADDIAYLTADIEDAFKKKLIDLNTIKQIAEKRIKTIGEDEDVCKYLKECLKDLSKLSEEDDSFNAIQQWLIKVQSWLMYGVTYSFTFNYHSIMDGQFDSDLFEGTYSQELVHVLREIAYTYIFTNKEIQKLEIAANRILGSLLDIFVPAVLNYDTDEKMSGYNQRIINLISESHMKVYQSCSKGVSDKEKIYLRLLMVTDFVSGMTDSYAKTLYKELNGLS